MEAPACDPEGRVEEERRQVLRDHRASLHARGAVGEDADGGRAFDGAERDAREAVGDAVAPLDASDFGHGRGVPFGERPLRAVRARDSHLGSTRGAERSHTPYLFGPSFFPHSRGSSKSSSVSSLEDPHSRGDHLSSRSLEESGCVVLETLV